MIDFIKRLSELERLVENIVRFGVIEEADYKTARVRVRLAEELLSDWLPWAAPRALDNENVWDAPEIGERVMIIAPGGRTENAFVQPALITPSTDRANTPDIIRRQHADGSVESYNRQSHEKAFELVEAGTFIVRIGSTEIIADKDTILMKADTVRVQAGAHLVEANQQSFDVDTHETGAGSVAIVSSDIALGDGPLREAARVTDSVANRRISSGSSQVRVA